MNHYKKTYFLSNMTDKKTTIPWADEEVWSQAVLSITKTISVIFADFSHRLEVEAMQTLVQHIVDGYAEIETVLERVCTVHPVPHVPMSAAPGQLSGMM